MPQFDISNETLLGLGIVALAIVGWTVAQRAQAQDAVGTSASTAGRAVKKGKKKAKGAASAAESSAEEWAGRVQSAGKSAGKSASNSVGKAKAAVKGAAEGAQGSKQDQPAPAGNQGKKAKQAQAPLPSFADVADPQTDVHAPAQPVDGAQMTAGIADNAAASAGAGGKKPKTLAEKKTAKPRKTAVDDMIPAEDRPVGPSRVMKIVSPPSGAEETTDDGWDAAADAQGGADDNAQGSDGVAVGEGAGSDDAWERPKKAYASAARDDGWQSVPVKAKAPTSLNRFSALSSSSGHASPSASGSSTPTKIQRKNAAASARKAAAKAEDEHARLERLAAHRREQERERVAQLPKKKTTAPGVKTLSGGMTASVNEKGSLIWE